MSISGTGPLRPGTGPIRPITPKPIVKPEATQTGMNAQIAKPVPPKPH